MAFNFQDFLPQGDGMLPRWILTVAVMAIFNTIQNFATTKLTRRIYNVLPNAVTPLQARTFGVWTLMSAVVRVYAAYNIHDKSIYDMTLLSFLIAFGHFSSEILIFRTATLSAAVVSPVIVSSELLSLSTLSAFHS
ncbi:hypothetical protein EW026_g118 [Hermanssonia centrifuga]|uniref:Ergosterol biosynthetic protein 28 n=1 Tax=Hermanssonia centrifuga TaxID=98765 RepID=A0A4S4KVI7_9APHY|nr:hypothetical protein EW026_g118 [Hermanssonia centrifuga]